MLRRISDHFLGLIPNFSNITHFFCAGRGMRILYIKAKGRKKHLQHYVGITMLRLRPLGPNDSHISHPQREKEIGLMLGLLCLCTAWDLGMSWDLPRPPRWDPPALGNRCSAQRKMLCLQTSQQQPAASPPPASLPSGNYPLPCFNKLNCLKAAFSQEPQALSQSKTPPPLSQSKTPPPPPIE